jgi:dihydrofolate synthase/folylpolyglutamate synthase
VDPSASFDFIRSLGQEVRPGAKYDLAQITALLEALGRPQRRFVSVHIAGTNGKGSVAAGLESVLRAAGFRTGLYTSPHLERLTERIRVAGAEIGEQIFATAVARVRQAAEELLAAGRLPHFPSFFEVLTAVGFVTLAEAEIEIGVIEVGMGGRLDATNVVQPAVAVITPVGRDHEQFLGHTLAEIAAEKAGIIKPGLPVLISAPQEADAAAVIDARCRALGVPLVPVEPDAVPSSRQPDGTYVIEAEYCGQPVRLHSPLRGRHQIGNTLTVLRACEALDRAGFAVPPPALEAGIAAIVWPGRLERLAEQPEIYVDGAHNPAAARVLAAFLDDYAQDHPRPILIYGSMRDKAIEEIAGCLFPRAASVIVTAPQGHPRAASPAELETLCRRHGPSCVQAPDLATALAQARQQAGSQIPIFITGSLFLVGEARSLLAKTSELR